MNALVQHGDFVVDRRLTRLVCHRQQDGLEVIEHALSAPGELIKRSRKSETRRVNSWIVKASLPGWVNMLKHTFQRARYRRAWFAAQHLERHGIGVPRTVAFIERRFLGLIFGNVLVSEELHDARDVEAFTLALIRRGAGEQTFRDFLTALAEAVNALVAARAFHADLSGKNIYTRDGTRFWFIDLDDVTLNETYDEERRLKNHAQLYDSFCDALGDQLLVPFIREMLPPEIDPRVWMPRVRQAQSERRGRHEERNPGAPRPLLPD